MDFKLEVELALAVDEALNVLAQGLVPDLAFDHFDEDTLFCVRVARVRAFFDVCSCPLHESVEARLNCHALDDVGGTHVL